MWNISIGIAIFIAVLGVLFFFEGIYRLSNTISPKLMAWLWTIGGAILLLMLIVGYLQSHAIQ